MIVDGECCNERLGLGKVGVRGLGIRHMSEKEWEWKELMEEALVDGRCNKRWQRETDSGLHIGDWFLSTTHNHIFMTIKAQPTIVISESDHYDGDVGLSSNPLKGNVTARSRLCCNLNCEKDSSSSCFFIFVAKVFLWQF